jgi:hypothetical protein
MYIISSFDLQISILPVLVLPSHSFRPKVLLLAGYPYFPQNGRLLPFSFPIKTLCAVGVMFFGFPDCEQSETVSFLLPTLEQPLTDN